MPESRNAFVLVDTWAGRFEQPVVIVGETAKRYRIASAAVIRLAGRNRFLSPGTTALVPKTAVRLASPEKKD